MTKEQAIKFANCLKNNYTIDIYDVADFCDMAIKALEQNTVSKEVYDNEHFARKEAEQKLWELQQNVSDDCVSRKAMLNAITEIDNNVNMDIYTNEVREIIKALPPVTSTRKVGKWIRKPIRNEKGGCIGAEMICSYCKKDNEQDKKLAYCPNCGAEMRGNEDENYII